MNIHNIYKHRWFSNIQHQAIIKKSNTLCSLYIHTKLSLIHPKSWKLEEVGEKEDIENKINLGNWIILPQGVSKSDFCLDVLQLDDGLSSSP